MLHTFDHQDERSTQQAEVPDPFLSAKLRHLEKQTEQARRLELLHAALLQHQIVLTCRDADIYGLDGTIWSGASTGFADDLDTDEIESYVSSGYPALHRVVRTIRSLLRPSLCLDTNALALLPDSKKHILAAMLKLQSFDGPSKTTHAQICIEFDYKGNEVNYRHEFSELKKAGFLEPAHRSIGCWLSVIGRRAAEWLNSHKVRDSRCV